MGALAALVSGALKEGSTPTSVGRDQASIVRILQGLLDAVNDQDKKKDDSIKTKLVGTWVVEEGKGLAKGDTLQFTKDGKVTVTHKRDDKERKVQGTYKVEGDKLVTTKTKKGEEKTKTVTTKNRSPF